MKKCPMMMNTQLIRSVVYDDGTKDNNLEISTVTDCIGSQCAAYVERRPEELTCDPEECTWDGPEVYDDLNCGDKCGYCKVGNKWTCAMMPREVWHDVENS